MAKMSGLGRAIPVWASFTVFFVLASVGLPGLNGFVGEFLILIGAFRVSWVWGAFAVTGIVLGAAYMLWLYQRTMLGKLENPANATLRDLSLREVATFVPLIVLAFWIGIYPSPFLRRLESSVNQVVLRVNPSIYGPALAKSPADCNTPAAAGATTPPPPGFTITAPCADASTPAAPAANPGTANKGAQ
jgi:NADH-quinone oxidoreductase subunit M